MSSPTTTVATPYCTRNDSSKRRLCFTRLDWISRLFVIVLAIARPLGIVHAAQETSNRFSPSPPKSTSTSTSTSTYQAMRALDKYGSSVQLKHAREAAVRRGRLVLAAAFTVPATSTVGSSTTQITPQNTNLKSAATEEVVIQVISLGKERMVHSLTLPVVPSVSSRARPCQGPVVAMCCAGIKGDALWLMERMQSFVAQVWERYNYHPLSLPALAHSMSRWITTSVLDQQSQTSSSAIDMEWQSVIGEQKSAKSRQYDPIEDSMSFTRPLGVQTLLMSTASTKTADSRHQRNLLLVEPTGRVFDGHSVSKFNNDFSYVCMGQNSAVLLEKLDRHLSNDPAAMDDVERTLIHSVLETLSPKRNQVIELTVETIRNSGIQQKCVTYRNGEQISNTPFQATKSRK